ncbi:hypothetical protein [Actinomadura verrucosospora]|uniref:hypothetical protein n=1 Tax=Actinomadura verrucosospora TaxID=46165 RepID=UPI001564CC47|nr:hypothetical protein [Actinomadura verrucosospora]
MRWPPTTTTSHCRRGTAELRKRFTKTFFSELWERPVVRKRWALRWRTAEYLLGEIVGEEVLSLGAEIGGHVRFSDKECRNGASESSTAFTV